ncbi:hypothetical protein E2C01_022822 [Portunus trituberculatus]|uniref:Uncharacterized protein n=1 Tax=Portunus trituberculatus TaxID=210409 RepID=A0A5B7E6F0_PORTR|nr:hypothetical protein [Portunus trituberculatus]
MSMIFGFSAKNWSKIRYYNYTSVMGHFLP